MTDFAIEFKNVTKKYDGFVLDNVSFALPRGCIMGLIGANGAGKSTIINLMLDITAKDSGNIRVLGCSSTDLTRELKEKIGVVFDESFFPENMKLKEVEKVLANIYKSWDKTAFSEYMRKFALPQDKVVKDFSRGMKMKLSIACALSHNAELLVLDEATSGLDPIVRDEILDIFLDFIQDENHSVLISSHITSDLEKVCDYVTFINEGHIVMSDEKDLILEKYAVVKCGEDEFDMLPQDKVIGVRIHKFGAEALMEASAVPHSYAIEPADLEKIMLFTVKRR
ncbi:MAG: ABC transporter ATP-binding protein [Firmicutes bacterium]|nr:ABC transporter ATP-binding protein [Bacillota bacterium]